MQVSTWKTKGNIYISKVSNFGNFLKSQKLMLVAKFLIFSEHLYCIYKYIEALGLHQALIWLYMHVDTLKNKKDTPLWNLANFTDFASELKKWQNGLRGQLWSTKTPQNSHEDVLKKIEYLILVEFNMQIYLCIFRQSRKSFYDYEKMVPCHVFHIPDWSYLVYIGFFTSNKMKSKHDITLKLFIIDTT